ncbi:MAG: RluA family pseudouridine synthase [Patescibacteria group bacterium]
MEKKNKEPTVIYEDNHILALNKPAGLVMHDDGRHPNPAVTDWLIKNYPNLAGVGESFKTDMGESIDRPGIVHRLDKDTGGVVVVAKHQKVFLDLKKQFQERTVNKIYQAIVYGEIKMEIGQTATIDAPIGRNKKDPRRRQAGDLASGRIRPAVTDYSVMENFSGYTLVEARPQTGRTHQIRVHFKQIKHPVVGDHLYAPGREKIHGLARLALHAYSLSVSVFGQRLLLEAELPKDMKSALDYLRSLC